MLLGRLRLRCEHSQITGHICRRIGVAAATAAGVTHGKGTQLYVTLMIVEHQCMTMDLHGMWYAEEVLRSASAQGAQSYAGNRILEAVRRLCKHVAEIFVLCAHKALHAASLYERDIYPRTSFLSARKYVKQSLHPSVCRLIQRTVAAVEVEMLKIG